MKHHETRFQTSDNLSLYGQSWIPDTQAKAVIILIHGSLEHSGRYSHIAGYFVQHGYTVYAFDLRGHGRSEGERAFIGSFNLLLLDMESFIAFVRQKEINKPIFLLGHSAGGSIIVLSAINNNLPDIKGAILSAPVLKLNNGLPPIAAFFSSFIGKFLPRIKLNKLNAKLLSQDPKVISAYLKDPLVYKEGLFAGVLSEFIRTINKIQAQMEAVTIPLLILHGTKDYFADIKGSKQLYDRSCSKDKTLNLYDNFYHELFNEPEKERVFSDIIAWLNKRVELT
ncbi:MAG: alpha/beta hydrolase [Candidatus Omnitrophota bacterium]